MPVPKHLAELHALIEHAKADQRTPKQEELQREIEVLSEKLGPAIEGLFGKEEVRELYRIEPPIDACPSCGRPF